MQVADDAQIETAGFPALNAFDAVENARSAVAYYSEIGLVNTYQKAEMDETIIVIR
jgi:hypothetical protein